VENARPLAGASGVACEQFKALYSFGQKQYYRTSDQEQDRGSQAEADFVE